MISPLLLTKRRYPVKIKVRQKADVTIIEVEGKVNINSYKLIETVGFLMDQGVTRIIIDMQKVDFIDYNGLSVLAITYKSALNRKGMMKLSGVSLHALELLRIVKLDDVFDIYNTLKEALASFKKNARASKAEMLEKPFRRRFQRLKMDIPIYFRLSRRLAHKGEDELYSGRMANISGAGVFVHTINILPPGSEVDVEIVMERLKKPRVLKGMVLWAADKELQPDLYPGMGIGFSGLSRQAQEEIIEFIEKNVVHRKG